MRVVRHSKLVLVTLSMIWQAVARGQGTAGAASAPVARAGAGALPTPTKTPAPVKAATAAALPAPPPGKAGGSPAQGSSVFPPKPPGPTPFVLYDMYYFEPATGAKYVGIPQPGNSWLLPRVDTMKAAGVSFLFTSNVPKQEIADIVEKRLCCSELLVSGRSAQVTALTFSGDKVFVRAVVPDMTMWPKTVQLHLFHQGVMSNPSGSSALSSPGGAPPPSGVGQLQAPVSSAGGSGTPLLRPFMDYKSTPVTLQTTKVSYFEKNLFATFSNARCTDCHAMGDQAAVRAQHDAGGILNVDARNAHQTGCGKTSCHTLVNDWRTPPFAFGINWKGKSAKEICTIVTNHLPSAEKLHTHFDNDPRVIWAVSSGWVPGHIALPTAPPHNAQAWLQLIDYWIDGGFPCP